MTRYLFPYLRQNFVALHNNSLDGRSFSDLMKFLNDLIHAYENPHRQREPALAPIRSVMQRQIAVPRNPSQRYLYYLNRSPRRRGRL